MVRQDSRFPRNEFGRPDCGVGDGSRGHRVQWQMDSSGVEAHTRFTKSWEWVKGVCIKSLWVMCR